MPKITSAGKAHSAKNKKTANNDRSEGFNPCSQDMTICGDCEGNRTRKKCPRLREWLERRGG